MLMTVDEFKRFVTTDKEDSVLEAKLQALELLVRAYTNNNFQARCMRIVCSIMTGKLFATSIYIKEGDTVQISESRFNDGIYTVKSIEDGFMELDKPLYDEPKITVTRVEYPMDVKMGVVELMKYDFENEGKIGVASETISRHSVTYFDMAGDNSAIGYPKALVGFLKPYMKARF